MDSTQQLAALRGDLLNLIAGTFFVVVALLAFGIAAIRRKAGTKVLVWVGMLSGCFGTNLVFHIRPLIAALPESLQGTIRIASVFDTYFTLVVGLMVFLELTSGALRRLTRVWLAGALVVGVAGVGTFLVTGTKSRWILANQVLAVSSLLSMAVTLFVPKLARRNLVFPGHKVLTAGTSIFLAEAIYSNVASALGRGVNDAVISGGFAVLLLSFGYVALEMVNRNEVRLVSIDRELEIARELQFSILPAKVPKLRGVDIAAKYVPMSAVAGDFYEFIDVDEERAGILVADVSGHGVAAALIASMIKVAMHSVKDSASDPGEVMRRLGETLESHLRGQFVSAAYLWIDLADGAVRYSAAGHPPLLRWNSDERRVEPIESNGLLFGVRTGERYPVREIPLRTGDRFFLYTDGLTETENARGEQFGDVRLSQLISEKAKSGANEISTRLLEEMREWQSSPQAQDDLTLVVVEVGAAGERTLEAVIRLASTQTMGSAD